MSTLRATLIASLVPILGAVGKDAEAPSRYEIARIVAAADKVLQDSDSIRAARDADRVFEAARALLKAGEKDKGTDYLIKALQLSPWNLEEQLNYALLLKDAGKERQATEIAEMVSSRAENDKLFDQAGKLLGREPVGRLSEPDPKHKQAPWVCLVKVGWVNDVVLNESAKKLQTTLGIPVNLWPETIHLPQAHRSAFGRWVKNDVVPNIRWDTPQGEDLLAKLGVTKAADANASELVNSVLALMREANQSRDAENLAETAQFMRKHDQQWDAERLLGMVNGMARGLPDMDQAIVIGITESDMFTGENNYIFGLATTGQRRGVVSYARYRHDMFNEPPDRARLVLRMHKQLLSSVGNSLGVPRPTDPTSARAYPASLPEHDAKSEFMSEACIEGFEKALGVKLPEVSHKPRATRR